MTENRINKDQIIILIPSLNPDDKMEGVVSDLFHAGFHEIFLVDDGSDQKNKCYFQNMKEKFQCNVLTHCTNLGKGRALKTGLNEIANTMMDYAGVITVDGDGQHLIGDIEKLAEKLYVNQKQGKEALIMGCRDFSADKVPFRSRMGNIATSKVMAFLCGIHLSDTQTGLRGISEKTVSRLVALPGERFEYELNMILFAKENEIPIEEILISTVYLEENKSSHFRPLQDSIKIYAQFGRFIFSSISSFVVDIILFTAFLHFIGFLPVEQTLHISVCTIGARILSAIYNYMLNKKKVFGNKQHPKNSMVRYAILAIMQCMLSAFFVSFIFSRITVSASIIKIIVDSCLFLVSFQIQREWVFHK